MALMETTTNHPAATTMAGTPNQPSVHGPGRQVPDSRDRSAPSIGIRYANNNAPTAAP